VALILTKERPALPPGPDAEKEDLSPASMIRLFKNINFLYVLIIAFISMGIFNTLLTLIESIVTPRGLSINEAGMIGSVFVIAGILGAVILPIISDKLRRRKPLFVFGITLLAPLYFGITYVTDFLPLLILSGIAGFTIMGLAPILFQHGAEVAYPAQEGTSLGLILLMGQISGALFVFLFEAISLSTDSVALPMLIFVALTIIEIPLTIKMKESSLLNKTG
jgi:FLVCR family MFS transporter 7